jgi:RimJ/RimL family protein N-acetyltransferase
MDSDRILGSTRFYALSKQNRNLEIGYTWIDPSVWRSAVNTECKYLLLRHAFDALGCLRVALRTDSRNQRSQRAIERLGATREGVLRKHMILGDGYVRDTVYYSVIDTDWPRVKAFLEAELARPRG